MAHKWLMDINYRPYWKDDSKMLSTQLEMFKEQKEVYGFDARETWELDEVFAAWAYEHLKALKQYSSQVVDWESPDMTVKIPSFAQQKIDYDVMETVTIGRAIDTAIDNFEYFLQNVKNIDFESTARLSLQYAGILWGIILPYLWW